VAKKSKHNDEDELGANMDALLARFGVKKKRAQADVDTKVESIRVKLAPGTTEPDNRATKRSRKKKNHPRAYNWPVTRDHRLVGIAMCDAVLDEGDDALLAPFKEKNTQDEFSGSRALYEKLEDQSYWGFTRWLRLDPETRKEIAVEWELGRWYLWPKRQSHFVYIVAPHALMKQAPKPDCVAFLGWFELEAPAEGNATAKSNGVYYLYKDGSLADRNNWKSEFVGINETQLVIQYRLTYEGPGGSYKGVISLNRVNNTTVIRNIDCGGYVADSARAFRGNFNTLGTDQPADKGEFYCEELEQPLRSEDDLKKILAEAYKPLAKMLKIELP
jgi:hypothetical protein